MMAEGTIMKALSGFYYVDGGDGVLVACRGRGKFRHQRITPLVGDKVIFTDMDGVVTHYQVVALDILQPTAVEEMTAGAYDLTLFTCTYDSGSRLTVRCEQTEAGS